MNTEVALPAETPDLLIRVREASPAKLRRRLAGDLDTIVLRAMHKEPQRRYVSVEQFSEDIRRHLNGLPVIARRDSWPYRAGKFAIRHKVGDVELSGAIAPGVATRDNRQSIQMPADVFGELLDGDIPPLRLLMHRPKDNRVEISGEPAAQFGRRSLTHANEQIRGLGRKRDFCIHIGLRMTELGRGGSESQMARASS